MERMNASKQSVGTAARRSCNATPSSAAGQQGVKRKRSPNDKQESTERSPIAKRRKAKRHVAERLSAKSLKRYQRYYKLKPKHSNAVVPEVAKHFDGLHVEEKDVLARFLQTVKQAEREKRRK